MLFFCVFDSQGRSITPAATAPEGPWKVPTSGLKRPDDGNMIPAHVSGTETSIDATWSLVDGVGELDDVRGELLKRSDDHTTVQCTVE